jgi:hypothetical protein
MYTSQGGSDSANIGSPANSLATSSGLIRGGIIRMTTTVQLNEIKGWFNITAERELRFVVYDSTAGTSFTKIFEATITNPGTGGPRWYSSGPINVTLQAGKKYAIGVSWLGLAGLTYYWQTTPVPPIEVPFGTITGGLAQTAFPPPATITQGQTSSLYYTQIVTNQWLSILTNGSGTVSPGDSTVLGFRVYTSTLPVGTANSVIVVNTNDPFAPTVTVPVRVDVVTEVSEIGPGIPDQYSLAQNYPNPFNPTTRIEFALPVESIVRLKVYNILGQEVASLANEQRPAGYFVAEWNATNNAGNKLSSGVYFYRMEATSVDGEKTFTSLKKMLMLK